MPKNKGNDYIRTLSDVSDGEMKDIDSTSRLITLLQDKDILKSEAWIKAFDTPVDFYCFYATKLQLLIREMTKADRFLMEFKSLMDDMNKMKQEIMEKDTQLLRLQHDVTDLKCTLLQERTNYQTLLREHELTILKKKDYCRKFNAALLLGGVTEKDVGFLLQNNPTSPALLDKIGEVKKEIAHHPSHLDSAMYSNLKIPLLNVDKTSSHELDNPLILRKKIEILKTHITNLEKAKQNDTDAFHEAIAFAKEEQKIAHERFSIEAQKSAEVIRDAKALSLCLMKSKMDLLKKVITIEEDHLETKVELSHLKQTFDIEPFEKSVKPKSVTQKVPEKRSDILQQEFERTKNELLEKENIIKEYELKFCCMEKEYRRSKESHSIARQQYEGNRQKLSERIKMLEQRYEREDQRRKLEKNGFHQDIQSLRKFLITLERRVNSAINKQHCDHAAIREDNGEYQVTANQRKTALKSQLRHSESEKHIKSEMESHNLKSETLNQIFQLASNKLDEVERKIKKSYT